MSAYQPLACAAAEVFAAVRYILTDIDDTLTLDGRLPAASYAALWRLAQAGYQIVPVTGRPAGWCDMIARFWPVAGVVGENGALYFRYHPASKTMRRRYWKSDKERATDRQRLLAVQDAVLQRVPGCAVAADQAYREADLAIDFCEDVPPLGAAAVAAIVHCFTEAGATAKVSSIHVNGWFGDYDKLSMSRVFFAEELGLDIDCQRNQVLYAGDSPNDEPMFAFFPHSVGMANVLRFAKQIKQPPVWVTSGEGGEGFAELAAFLLGERVISPAPPVP